MSRLSRVPRPLRPLARLAARPLRAIRARQVQALVDADARGFRQALGPEWRADTPAQATEAVFISLSDWPWQLKVESTLGKAFAAHGHGTAILTQRNYWRKIRGYPEAMGVRPLLFDSYLDRVPSKQLDEAVAGALAGASTLRDLLDWTYAGAQPGKHAVSQVIRDQKPDRLDAAVKDYEGPLRTQLRRSAHYGAAAGLMLDDVKPSVLLFLERGYALNGPIFDLGLRRGLDLVQFSGSHRGDAFIWKRFNPENQRFQASSLAEATWADAIRRPWSPTASAQITKVIEENYRAGAWFNRKYLDQGRRIVPADEARSALGARPGRKIAVVFPHVLWDATFFYGTTLFGEYEAWLLETVRAAVANDALDWVIKIHPDHVWKSKMEGIPGEPAEMRSLTREFPRLPPHVRILPPETPIHTVSLYPVIDYAITVRGTIGIEAACFGVPVLTAGTGRYSGLGFTIDSTDEREYLGRLATLQDQRPLTPRQVDLARRYAATLFDVRPWAFTSFQSVYHKFDGLRHPLANDLQLTVTDWQAFRQAKDLSSLVQWVFGSDAEDYADWTRWPSESPAASNGAKPRRAVARAAR